MPYVQAAPIKTGLRVTVLLDVNPKQIGQLSRDWHAIVDVTDVRAGVPTPEMLELASEWTAAPHPPASAGAGATDTHCDGMKLAERSAYFSRDVACNVSFFRFR